MNHINTNSTVILQTLQKLENVKCGRVKFCEMQKDYIAFFTFSFRTWYCMHYVISNLLN